MAFEFTERYEPEVEEQMRGLFQSLSEKDRRRYAAVEAAKLGHGGVQSIAEVLGCSRRTIERGTKELRHLPDDPAAGRVRRPGGGRKPKVEADPQLDENLSALLQFRTAGDPEDEGVRWTDLSLSALADQLQEQGTPASPPTIQKWLEDDGLSRRKIAKSRPGGASADRDRQFERIACLRARYAETGDPVFSVDTKAKEHLGFLYRAGRVWTQQPQRAFDHDFPAWAEGVLIPHGIYDLRRNHGHINLGLSRDTSEFACDSFFRFWSRIGRHHSADATRMLWLCDAGGSNNYRHHIFKQDLQDLAGRIGLPIRVAHYPSYCSKFNPIDRRFFPHVARACRGVLFDSLATVQRLMRKTSTRTGLTATVDVIKKAYAKCRKVRDDFPQTTNIAFDALLPQWNYTAPPH